MLGDLYNRDFSLTVGGIPLPVQTGDILQPDNIDTQLRVTFDVERNSNKDPNRAEVTVYNFNLANRGILEIGQEIADTTREAGLAYDWPLVIEAGYMGSREVIFSGNITYATSRRENVDWITTIECGDGENKYRKNRMNKSYGLATPITQVAIDAAVLLDVGPGNLAEKLGPGVFRKGFSVYSQGFVASGSAADVLDAVLTSAGFTWSIQDGNLQILAPEETTFEEVVILAPHLGLIGSPEKKAKGKIAATSLLQGSLKPGRRVIIESETVTGMFKIERVTHFGDTFGNEWYSEIEAKPVTI